MDRMRDTTRAKNMLLSLYLYFAAKIRALLRTRDTIFPSILPVSAKVAIFRNIVPLSMYQHCKNEHETYLPVTIWVYLCIAMLLLAVLEEHCSNNSYNLTPFE